MLDISPDIVSGGSSEEETEPDESTPSITSVIRRSRQGHSRVRSIPTKSTNDRKAEDKRARTELVNCHGQEGCHPTQELSLHNDHINHSFCNRPCFSVNVTDPSVMKLKLPRSPQVKSTPRPSLQITLSSQHQREPVYKGRWLRGTQYLVDQEGLLA